MISLLSKGSFALLLCFPRWLSWLLASLVLAPHAPPSDHKQRPPQLWGWQVSQSICKKCFWKPAGEARSGSSCNWTLRRHSPPGIILEAGGRQVSMGPPKLGWEMAGWKVRYRQKRRIQSQMPSSTSNVILAPEWKGPLTWDPVLNMSC